MGAKDFLIKPFGTEEARIRVENLLEARTLHRQLLTRGNVMEHRLAERTSQLRDARLDVLERLAMAAEYRDDSTHEHPQAWAAPRLRRASRRPRRRPRVELIRHAAPLHDIGKIGIPDSVLLKPGAPDTGRVRADEGAHLIGADILAGSGRQLLSSRARSP